MMRILTRYALLLTLLIVTLCTSAMWGGRIVGMANDARIRYFDFCEGYPCLLGLIPGKTDWPAAQIKLTNRVPDFVPSDTSILVEMDTDTEAQVFISVNLTNVGRIYVALDRPIAAAWIILRYGKPCGVSVYLSSRMVTLRYPFLLANGFLKRDQISLDMPMTYIQFIDPNFYNARQPNICVDNVTSRQMFKAKWRGFATLWAYTDR